MLTLLICTLLGALLLYLSMVGDPEFAIPIGALVGAFVGFMLAALVIGNINPPTETKSYRTPLVSLTDRVDVQGRFSGGFFLATGSIKSRPVFAWYERTGSNTYEQRHAPTSKSQVHYLPEGEDPYYLYRQKDHVNDVGVWGIHMGYKGDSEYDFYVPHGTIKQSYELDAR